MSENALDQLATISPDNEVPSTRFSGAPAVQDFVKKLCQNDDAGGNTVSRSYKRGRVNGLVDGNPPYRHSNLLRAGRGDAFNANLGVGRAYLEGALGPFYDLFAEASGYMEVCTEYGTPDERAEWSRVISEEINWILEDSSEFENMIQLSQWEMVLHGSGPLLFPDGFEVFPTPVHCGDLKAPEFTRSDVNRWEAAAVIVPYYPPEAYKFIRNEPVAKDMGWNTGYTKKVIANAMEIRQGNNQLQDWEFYQQELKNNSGSYMETSKIIWVAHVFWREFSGKITHAIVERETHGAQAENKEPIDYLFFHHERYDDFTQCIHPMYFDRGNGGYHHSVTGLGVKMFAALEWQNRALLKLGDDLFLPKTMFAPTSPSATQKFTLTHFGAYGLIPPGFEIQQVGVNGVIGDQLAIEQKISSVLDSNLSAYRQQVTRKEGNPVTAKQVMYEAGQQSSLGKTQINRYYKQLDGLYKEMYRRFALPDNPNEASKRFRKCCKDRGVPPQALAKVKSVRAIRVVGQGNNFMRQDALERAWVQYGPALPEEGRSRLLTDGLAAGMGYLQAQRYNPQPQNSSLADDQRAEATQWVAAMKVGVPAVVTPTQNPVTYATVFTQSAAAAAESLQQGANPTEVYAFLQMAGPAIYAHLQRFPQDPARQQLLKGLTAQWQQLAKMTDDLGQMIQDQMEQQAEAQQTQQVVLNDQQLKAMKLQGDMQLKQAKTAAQLQQSQERHQQKMLEARQNMALKDATTASDIHRKNVETTAEQARAQRESEAAELQEA